MNSKLTQAQPEALIRLLAKATNAGLLPSMLDTNALLDLIESGIRNRLYLFQRAKCMPSCLSDTLQLVLNE